MFQSSVRTNNDVQKEGACIRIKIQITVHCLIGHMLSATFAIADRKAEAARFTSDLSTTDINTDACTDIESRPEGKRMTKRPLAYSPECEQGSKHEHSAKQKQKETAAVLPDALHSLPPVPRELVDLSIHNDTTTEHTVNENMQLVEPEHESTSPAVSQYLSQTDVSVKHAHDSGRTCVRNLTSSKDNSFACDDVGSQSNQHSSQNRYCDDSHDNASGHRVNILSTVEGRDDGVND